MSLPKQHEMQVAASPNPKPPRRYLRAAALALVLFVALVFAADTGLGAWEVRYLQRLAPSGEDVVIKGLSLTQAALSREDMMVLLGSSELTFQDDYHPVRLFAAKPTGFSAFVVGSGYRQSIHNFLALAAMDEQVRGKRIALFISPSWFSRTIPEKAYQKNFSLLQAYEFAFDPKLSNGLNRRGAARLLALGSPATDDALLRVTLEAMASDSPGGRAAYYALWPVGRSALAFLRLRDKVELFKHVWSKDLKPSDVPARPAQIDWAALSARAAVEARARSASNSFGIHDDYYARYVGPRLGEIQGSSAHDSWAASSEYADLQLVLDALRELGARPLFISLPVMGSYYDFKAHPVTDRKAYYARVRAEIRGAGFPVADFGDSEYEPGFMRDPWHPGWKGSVRIAEALDQFYHGRLAAAGR